jgi:hypothetical protein
VRKASARPERTYLPDQDPALAAEITAGRPGAFRPQGQELFGVAGQLLFREPGDEIPQRHGLIE